jgi:hypothetical protein
MSDYRCTKSFVCTTYGNHFWVGQIISVNSYDKLNQWDQVNFEKVTNNG